MICIENLDFGYQKKREVFSGLNLSLTGGHIYGLLGKNGAGKTIKIDRWFIVSFARPDRGV